MIHPPKRCCDKSNSRHPMAQITSGQDPSHRYGQRGANCAKWAVLQRKTIGFKRQPQLSESFRIKLCASNTRTRHKRSTLSSIKFPWAYRRSASNSRRYYSRKKRKGHENRIKEKKEAKIKEKKKKDGPSESLSRHTTRICRRLCPTWISSGRVAAWSI